MSGRSQNQSSTQCKVCGKLTNKGRRLCNAHDPNRRGGVHHDKYAKATA
jgi:hypothetical protein